MISHLFYVYYPKKNGDEIDDMGVPWYLTKTPGITLAYVINSA